VRIERIVARAFGPFQGDVLELAPGMTVVAGPNESGKSSWHAALRLAVTGVRRGKGPGTAAERQLAERHRPWGQAERWEVEARLALDDGRTIDISQDLGGKVACRAVDVALGRDVSDEIMDGTPDASRWLGLDRDAFAATVSVGQAQILAVADAAEELHDQMQRAAATRGTDATAAEAIARLEGFRKDAVGADTVAAKGPLRTAKNRERAAQAALEVAQRLHAEYLERGARLDLAEQQADEAHRRLAGAEAARARLAAAEAEAKATRAATLSARYPAPPATLAARDERADRAAAALASWRSGPESAPLDGRSAADIQAEINRLPLPPNGDTRPHPSVIDAGTALAIATDAARLLGDRPRPEQPLANGWDAPDLRDLARRLRHRQLSQAAALEAELARLRSRQASAPRGVSSSLAIAAGVAALASVAGWVAGLPALSIGLIACAVTLGGVALRLGRGSGSLRARIAHAEAALAPYRLAAEEAIRDRQEAERTARDAGLPDDPAALDELADRAVAAAQVIAAADDWDRRQAGLRARQAAAAEALRSALLERGEDLPEGTDLVAAVDAYRVACESRSAQHADASRSEVLRAELRARREAEESAATSTARRQAAEDALRASAAELGLSLPVDAHPADVARALEAWQQRRGIELQTNQQAQAEWQQLQTLLDGGTLQDLQAEASRRRQRASELATDLPPGIVALPETDDPERQLASLRAEEERLRREMDLAAGALAERRVALPDVAEAEEATAAASAELGRVEALARDLDTTLRLLRAAQERVHRDLAPVLGKAVARWLPIVSRGAYTEISVDPSDLAVSVKEAGSGQWRNARLLSEGTREQVYLLLRVAMAEHLVTTAEKAPLLLDEVTAQSDGERKRELLSVLHQLSGDRQVILFTHDDEVVAWAESALHAPDDRLVRLPAVVATARVPVPITVDQPTEAREMPALATSD
jgi:DNA repair protein SbcC/Rad50